MLRRVDGGGGKHIGAGEESIRMGIAIEGLQNGGICQRIVNGGDADIPFQIEAETVMLQSFQITLPAVPGVFVFLTAVDKPNFRAAQGDEIVCFGINYDPSHFIWQQIDYVKPLYEFKDKIFHVHFKDIKMFPDKLNDYGIMAYPLDYMSPKLPGYGDVNWGKYVSALTDIGFDGYACIEVEDKAFESCREKILDSIRISKRYMEQFVI